MNSRTAKVCFGALSVAVASCGVSAQSQDSPAAGTGTLSSEEHCKAVIASVEEAGFNDEAWVTCDATHAVIHSDSYPSHKVMTGIIGTNEQIPVPAEGYYAKIKLESVPADALQTRDSSIAIAVNGIPIFDYTAGGEMSQDDLYRHQPHLDTVLINQLDECGGHTGRGDDYHYHEKPRCMLEQMDNAGDNAIIAWGFDGFPIYGDNNPDGSEIARGALDVCNGQPDPVFGYRYHTSDEPPYIIQCVVGEVDDLGDLPRIGTTRPSGRPVQVDDLDYAETGNGVRSLTYNYRGESYYIRYRPTGKTNCYYFESKTVTAGGKVEEGEHCVRVTSGPRLPGGGGPPPPGGDRGPRERPADGKGASPQ